MTAINQQVIDFIRANPMRNNNEIADGVGISRGLMRGILADLFSLDLVDRYLRSSRGYQYFVKSGAGAVANAEYSRARKLAEELEAKGLWRRAAHQWLLAMESTTSASLLDKAASRRASCMRRSAVFRPDSYSRGAIRDASASSLPALAAWRD